MKKISEAIVDMLGNEKIQEANLEALVKLISALGDTTASLVRLEVEFKKEKLRSCQLKNQKFELEIEGLKKKFDNDDKKSNGRPQGSGLGARSTLG